MGLFRRNRDDGVQDENAEFERRLARTVQTVTHRIGDSPVDSYFACMLMAAVSAAAGALGDVAQVLREDRAEDEDGSLITESVAALLAGLDAEDLEGPVVSGAWTFTSRVIAEMWPDQYDEVLEVAAAGLGEPCAQDRAVAAFGPFAEDNKDGDFVRFHRLSLEAIVRSATGRDHQVGEIGLGALMAWTDSVNGNWPMFHAMLERLAPDGTDSFAD